MIKIDLDNTIEPTFVNGDLTEFIFQSELRNGENVSLYVKIAEHPDGLLKKVFNLGFGPLREDGLVDDTIQLHHKNVSLVLSTVLLFGIIFLQVHPDCFIGIDGSNDLRAYLYHRMFKYNVVSLSETIDSLGVYWYVRLLRNGEDIERDSDGSPFFKPRLEPFDSARPSNDLYRYYLFKLNK